jgi:hypothetical protein
VWNYGEERNYRFQQIQSGITRTYLHDGMVSERPFYYPFQIAFYLYALNAHSSRAFFTCREGYWMLFKREKGVT